MVPYLLALLVVTSLIKSFPVSSVTMKSQVFFWTNLAVFVSSNQITCVTPNVEKKVIRVQLKLKADNGMIFEDRPLFFTYTQMVNFIELNIDIYSSGQSAS